MITFFYNKKIRIFFNILYTTLFLLFIQNNIAFGMEKEESFTTPTVKFVSIPREMSVEWASEEPVYITPDFKWHKTMHRLVNNSYERLEAACQKKNPYNVATFQIRTVWSDGKEKAKSFSHLLFLSKMNLNHLWFNVEYVEKKKINNKNELLGILGLGKHINDLMCFGDFFNAIETKTPEHLARKSITELFGFKEQYGEDLRERYTKSFKSKLGEEDLYAYNTLIGKVDRFPVCKKFCKYCYDKNSESICQKCTTCSRLYDTLQPRFYNGWKQLTDTIGDMYNGSLYGLLPFDETSNSTARKYFKGETATNAFLKFDQNFADSEQAIYQFLLRLNNEDTKELNNENTDAILKSIIIDIVSYRPICKFCEGTALRYVENEQIATAIKASLKRESSNPNFTFWVSYVKSKSEEGENE